MKMVTRYLRQSGLNHLSRNNYKKAAGFLRKVYEREPHSQGSAYNLAVALMGLKQFDQAEPLLIQELEQFGEDFPRLRGLGDLYYLWGQPQDAKTWYQRTLEICDSEPEKRLLKKRMEICSSKEAFDDTRKSINEFDTGNSLVEAHQYGKAVEAFKRAAEYDETNFLAWNNIGTLCYLKLNDPKRAMESFKKAARYSSMPSLLSNMETVKRVLEQS